MPQRITSDAIHVSMTDHRIERRPTFVNPEREDHVPYMGPLVTFFTHGDAMSLERANTLDPTVNDLRRFLAANPADTSLRIALGRALIRAGRFDEAVAVLEKSSDSAGRTYLAVACAVRGETRRALAILKEVVAENPDYALAWINLGITQEALGNKAGAIAAYERAILIQPDASEARRRLNALRQAR
jgi:tetratricopeptide (TPR) repeat protein